jgi:hypothetical protein
MHARWIPWNENQIFWRLRTLSGPDRELVLSEVFRQCEAGKWEQGREAEYQISLSAAMKFPKRATQQTSIM